jgi:nucleoside-diphosphate-sugar epimerase
MNGKGQPATCLVTGVAGFIGSHLAENLLSLGHQVVGVDCFADYYARSIKDQNLQPLLAHKAFSFLTGDLLQLDLPALLSGESAPKQAPRKARVDFIFHLAAQAGVRASWGRSFEIYTRNNILATQQLLEAARQVTLTKFVYASSSSVYGDAETYPTTEDMTPHPISPYGVSKLAGEHLCMLYWRNYRVPTAALRYFTVYGPRQRPDMGFNRFIRAILQGEEIEIYGDGEQTRDFTYVEDAVQGTIAAAMAEASGEVFNIGGGSRVTVNEVIRSLESILQRKARLNYIAEQKGDVRHTSADTSKARRLLGYQPQVTLTQGLEREAAWMQKSLLAARVR